MCVYFFKLAIFFLYLDSFILMKFVIHNYAISFVFHYNICYRIFWKIFIRFSESALAWTSLTQPNRSTFLDPILAMKLSKQRRGEWSRWPSRSRPCSRTVKGSSSRLQDFHRFEESHNFFIFPRYFSKKKARKTVFSSPDRSREMYKWW